MSDFRFINNDELKFSLRSVEKYAPWINKIFIVTDGQTPDWLDLNNPKIRIVDHTEIIPKEKLPLFNSCAIESRIPFIEELSEHFLYANDACFFWDSIGTDYFFKNGKPIFRFNKPIKMNKKKSKRLYAITIQKAYTVVSSKYKIPVPLSFPDHNIDSYTKSIYQECIKEFSADFDETLSHRSRENIDVQRTAIAYYALARKEGYSKYVQQGFLAKKVFKLQSDSRCLA